MENKRPEWTSYLSFIFATVGSAVGLGNIWRFPYIMGENGGAVFLIVYLVMISLVCAVPLCMELAMGKIYKSCPISVYEKINPKFKPLGYLCFITPILIQAFYYVVGGWILNYLWIFITNSSVNDFSAYFQTLSANPFLSYLFTLLFLIMAAIFPYFGINKGIEKANNIIMPLFGIMLIALVICALNLSGAKEGLLFMFHPDFTKLTPKMFLAALGQALFTLSIGMGIMITYGSYLKKDVDVKKSAYTLIFFDTLVAVLAGMIIFPIVFSTGIEPTSGAKLVFISLPQIFSMLPFSSFFAVVFFFLLFFAAITSGISLFETSVSCFVDYYKFKRNKASVLTFLIIALLSLPASLSFGLLSDFKIFDKTYFDFLDYITSNMFMPFGTLMVCIIAGYFAKNVADEAFSNSKYGRFLTFLLKYVIPLIFIYVLITGLN